MYPWGKEINYGAVLVLQLLFVESEYRRRGIAQMVLQAQIDMAEKQKRGLRFMFVKPGVFVEDVEDQIHDDMSLEEEKKVGRRAYANAVRFYRAFGFRRVGTSNWFCLAMDPEHPSHEIAPEDDPDPVLKSQKDIEELDRLMGILYLTRKHLAYKQ